MNDNKNTKKILEELSRKIGVPQDDLKSAAQSGNIQSLLNKTSGENADKINEILSDPQKTKQVLSSPQAQALLKLLNGE